jgi:hypothetical protein
MLVASERPAMSIGFRGFGAMHAFGWSIPSKLGPLAPRLMLVASERPVM